MNVLMQLQLSNYTRSGVFVLEADSGFQMMCGRVREMLKFDSNVTIDMIGPRRDQLLTQPEEICKDVFSDDRVRWIETCIVPNALVTRYDFDYSSVKDALRIRTRASEEAFRYDIVYINDPMLLRAYKTLFYLEGYEPKFVVHSHFVDCPSCPKFPTQSSLWHGQVEAAIKADWNFWQCESALEQFCNEMRGTWCQDVIDSIRAKSSVFDDGYSVAETMSQIDITKLRFDVTLNEIMRKKTVIFVPNRIGGSIDDVASGSSDYTNCGWFFDKCLPALAARRDDYVVIAGNPSQKFSNAQLTELRGRHGYMSVVPRTLTRDEYRWIARNSDIVVSLYDKDTYGATASRECIELGANPLWLDCYEYKAITDIAKWPRKYVAQNKEDVLRALEAQLDDLHDDSKIAELVDHHTTLLHVVRDRCSYERTTPEAFGRMKSLCKGVR